jgi:hypothetical protein
MFMMNKKTLKITEIHFQLLWSLSIHQCVAFSSIFARFFNSAQQFFF